MGSPRKEKLMGRFIIHGIGENAVEFFRTVLAPGVEGLEDHLGVAVAVELIAQLLQLCAKLRRIVELSVVDNGEIFVGHGLAATGRIHHHQPAVEQGAAWW